MRTRFIVIAILGTIIAVAVGPNGPLGGFWAPMPDTPNPRGALLAGFIGEQIVENAAFGVGLAILLTARRWFAARAATRARGVTAWLATVWLFTSWMPHSALHLHIGMQLHQLLPVEWIFHAGAIAALAALLWALSGSTPRTPTNTSGVAADSAAANPAPLSPSGPAE